MPPRAISPASCYFQRPIGPAFDAGVEGARSGEAQCCEPTSDSLTFEGIPVR